MLLVLTAGAVPRRLVKRETAKKTRRLEQIIFVALEEVKLTEGVRTWSAVKQLSVHPAGFYSPPSSLSFTFHPFLARPSSDKCIRAPRLIKTHHVHSTTERGREKKYLILSERPIFLTSLTPLSSLLLPDLHARDAEEGRKAEYEIRVRRGMKTLRAR